MSHKSSIATKISNREFLKRALSKIGFNFTEAKAGEKIKTQGHYGVNEDVDIRIEGIGNKNYDGAIGFVENKDGTFTATGDFYDLRDENNNALNMSSLAGIVTGYSNEAQIGDYLSNIGFTIAPEDVKKEDNTLKLQYRRWV